MIMAKIKLIPVKSTVVANMENSYSKPVFEMDFLTQIET